MNAIYKKTFKKPDVRSDEQKAPKTGKTFGKIVHIETDRLFPNPSQPRFVFEDEPLLRLADSVRRYGILQPLSVRRATDERDGAFYEIIAGERRWRAAKIIGLNEVPCVIFEVDSRKSAELALIENIQREDLNVFEQAAAIASLIDVYGMTQEQAARQLSSSQSYIANKLRILRLTPPERSLIIKNKLTERHARALLRIEDQQARLKALERIIEKDLNVGDSEKYIDSLLAPAVEATRNIKAKAIIKDLRFFYNSVDRAVNILKDCGVNVITEKKEAPGETAILIRIPRAQR